MKRWHLLILVCIIIVCVVTLLIKIFAVTGMFALFTSKPPEPEIKHGEFPFTLKYELNGETKIIEDVVICEFDGYINQGTSGTYRNWKTSLKSGNKNLTLLDLRQNEEKNDLNQTVLELYFSYGTGAYYMGDDENPFARNAQDFEWVNYQYETAEGKIGGSGYLADEAYDKYKIKLISWEIAPPITNTFK